jgi:hypothetical protein
VNLEGRNKTGVQMMGTKWRGKPDASGISAALEIEITFVNTNLQNRRNERSIVKAGGLRCG